MLSKLGLPSKPPPVAPICRDSQPRFDDFEGLPVFGAVAFRVGISDRFAPVLSKAAC